LLVSPLGKKFTRFYVDEVHDVLNCHPERAPKWLTLGHQFSKAEVQMILMSGTIPPHRVESYVKPFGIKKSEINEVRSSTNRPEIGIHVVQVEPIAARESLHHLVRTLSNLLGDNDRMLVFFSSQGETEDFSRKARCALYHSDLWEAGNTKAYNLDLWDRGASKVMSCTTAFAQGMDRSNVRYVVIFRPAYGLIVNNQMMGRAGRDGKESHVFFVNDRHGASLLYRAFVHTWMRKRI
ncbi:P-loop containing nucleoside triphosphate hydrolase protein, partial [Suillus ampliporus]